jgi:hypothetical protein
MLGKLESRDPPSPDDGYTELTSATYVVNAGQA